jgi:hypothetical protein
MAALTADARRSAKLRAVAMAHGWELAGLSVVLLPRTPARWALLREAWAEVESDARAGTLTGELAAANFGDGWRPAAWYWWSEPETDAERQLVAEWEAS